MKVYDVRRMPSDGKSSHGPWPGELKTDCARLVKIDNDKTDCSSLVKIIMAKLIVLAW